MKIDGKDISEYGLISLRGSFNDLFRYPSRRPIKYNNWAEADGIEPDLSVVEFEAKTIRLNFLLQAGSVADFRTKYNRLIADIAAPGYRVFDFDISSPLHLRYDATSTYARPVPFNDITNITMFTMDFIEDSPAFGSATNPSGGVSARGKYAVNGYDFGAFGIGSDKGIDDILKYPTAKPPFADGNVVNLETVRMQQKDIKLSLWMIANSKDEFLNNHAAFFNQIARTGTQELYVNGAGIIKVYYNDCSDFSVGIWENTKVICKFSVGFTIPVMELINA
jgi:hypothetical protein